MPRGLSILALLIPAIVLPLYWEHAARGQQPDADTLPSLAEPLWEPQGYQYRSIDPHECQCLAVQNSSLARLLEEQKCVARSRPQAESRSQRQAACCSARLETSLLVHAVEEAQDDSAAEALKAYYELVEAETARKALRDSEAAIGQTRATLEKLKQAGEKVDLDGIQRQQLKLESRKLELELSIQGLNEKLRVLMGFSQDGESWRIWPAAELSLIDEVDAEAAVVLAMEQHPRLRLLRKLRGNLSAYTVDVANRAMGSVHGMLASQPVGTQLFARFLLGRLRCPPAPELACRRRQLDDYLADQQQVISAEVRQAVREIGIRRRQVELERSLVGSWEQRVDRLQTMAAETGVSLQDLLEARLELVSARHSLVQRLISVQQAQVQLKHAQGQLAAGCQR